jgi:hypothetical protein
MRHDDAQARLTRRRRDPLHRSGTNSGACRCLHRRSTGLTVGAPVSSIPEANPEVGPGMYSVFYIIGVIVVVLAILSLLGLT